MSLTLVREEAGLHIVAAKTRAPVTVLIADDHPLVLRGLQALVGESIDFAVVAAVRDGAAALRAISKNGPAIAVLDITMWHHTGRELLKVVLAENLPTRIVLLTAAITDERVLEALAANVYGLVLKSAAEDELIATLRKVARGERVIPRQQPESAVTREASRRSKHQASEIELTPREMEIARLTIRGLSNKGIGRELHVAEGTVKL